MRTIQLQLSYLAIEELIDLIDQPCRGICRRILAEHRALFEVARGSTHNHQTWDGGYIDHITDGMNVCRHLYAFMSAFGRPLPFSESSALLVFFLHDLEKPWRILVENGRASNREGLATKEEFRAFREQKLKEYGLVLTPAQFNAFTYIEDEGGDYSSERRVMNEPARSATWSILGAHADGTRIRKKREKMSGMVPAASGRSNRFIVRPTTSNAAVRSAAFFS